jgi:hypothetical protein
MTTAISALAFSVVLAEAFAAVGLSTLVPAMFVELCRLVRAALAGGTNDLDTVVDAVLDNLPPLPGMPKPLAADADDGARAVHTQAMAVFKNAIKEYVKRSESIQLLVPNKASIEAEFNCSGGESYSGNAGIEGVFQVVGIKAGYSALFEMRSSATVRLHVDFAPVEFKL